MERATIYRRAEASDVAVLAKIRAAEWETEEYWQHRITAYLTGALDPQHALKPRIIYMAENGGVAVGLIAGHLTRRFQCDGELEWINVVADHRGSGVASALLRLLAEWFASQNALRVCVDVSPENLVARRFYSRHGATDLKPHWMIWNDIGKALHIAA